MSDRICLGCVYWSFGLEWGRCKNTVTVSKLGREEEYLLTRPRYGCPHYGSLKELNKQIKKFKTLS